MKYKLFKRVWRYQRGNQNPHIEEEQTTQWQKAQKDKQRSTKHTYKTNDRVIWTPLKTGGELRCSGRVSSSCSTSGTRRVNLVTNPVINREWGKGRKVFTTSGTYPWSFVTQIFHNGQPSYSYLSEFEIHLKSHLGLLFFFQVQRKILLKISGKWFGRRKRI
jgi:hypothetical protein